MRPFSMEACGGRKQRPLEVSDINVA